MNHYAFIDSPLGPILLLSDGTALTGLFFSAEKHCPRIATGWHESARAAPFAAARRQLGEYFSGKRRRFEVPLAPAGTEFQRQVWREIARVPCGETLTYGELARRAGRPKAARAAGAATGRNPISILIPCHRIVGADGCLTGYAGGLRRKKALLVLETATAGRLVGDTKRAGLADGLRNPSTSRA